MAQNQETITPKSETQTVLLNDWRLTEDEIAQDGRENGNRKLVPEDFRFGPGLEDGDYINMELDGKFTSLKELKTRNQLGLNRDENQLEPDAVDENF